MTRSFCCCGARTYYAHALALVLMFLCLPRELNAAEIPPKKFAVMASATVQEAPPRITLSWPADPDATGYTVNRRTMSTVWQPAGTLPGSATSYVDSNVTVGTKYEYQLIKTTSKDYTGYGYLAAGIRVPVLDSYGKIVLVVENSLAGPLTAELDRLQADLTGDGWTVVRRNVSMNDTPAAVKQVIKAAYDADPGNVRAAFLFGHVPVPYSGDLFPDGHENHQGAWPADVFYADMDGAWTDHSVNTTNAERQVNWNLPNDGKYDQSQIPSAVELMLGRVDLHNMTCYANKPQARTELDLMRQYLNKNHAFRTGQMSVRRRGLICDNFSDKGGDPIGGSAWRNFPGFFGAENIEEVPWDGYLPAATAGSYLWSYASGGGSYYYSMGVGTSDDFALQEVQVVFTMFMGSYFGDWNNESNFLRASLGSGSVLAASYSGFPHTLYFPMGMGETIGYGMWLSQNNGPGGLYPPFNQGTLEVHISLHGDPTLRLYPVKPVSNLVATSEPGTARLSWSASVDAPIVGYNVYRATTAAGPFAKLTPNPIAATAFSDTPAPGTYTYMVRAVKLEQSGGGTYLNPSQGVLVQGVVSGSVTLPPAAPTLQIGTVTDSRVQLTWIDLPDETGYRLEARVGSGNWSQIATPAANSTSYEHTGLPAATVVNYRLRAFNGGGDSAYSAEVTATTLAAPPSAPVLQVSSTTHAVVVLQWTDVANESGYVIERKTGGGNYTQVATPGMNVTSFNDETVAPSTSYLYRIRAAGAAGNSPYSAEVAANTQPAPVGPPPAPVLIATAASETAIDLSWNDVAGESSYRVESRSETTEWTQIATLLANSTTFEHSGLAPGTRYYYRIRAFSQAGFSAYSEEVSATTGNPAPQIPATPVLSLAGSSHSHVALGWSDVAGETGYRLQRRRQNEATWSDLGELAAGVVTFNDSNVQPSTSYAYRISAFNEAGPSSFSAELAVTTQAPPLQPPVTPALSVVAVTHHSVEVSWNPVANATEYRLEKRAGGSQTWNEIARLETATANYLDAGLAASTAYAYRIRAFNQAGFSTYSDELPVTTAAPPLQPPAAPVLQLAGSTHNAATVTWTDVANETGYVLERKTGSAGAWAEIAALEAGVAVFENGGLASSTIYFYRVRARNAAGDSAHSAEVSVTTAAPPLQPPAVPVLNASAVSHREVAISWNNVERESGFVLQRRGAGEATWTTIAALETDVTAYLDVNVLPSNGYVYRIEALNAAGSSGYSAEVSVSTPAEPLLPPAAPVLQATVVSHTEVKLDWNNVENETGYVIEWRPATSSSWSQLASVDGEVTTFSRAELTPETTYDFRVRAENAGGASAWNEAQATTSASPVGSVVAFITTDGATGGLWPLEYGGSGAAIPSRTSTLPAGVEMNITSGREVLWSESTAEERALIDLTGTNRVASSWMAGPLTLNLAVAGDEPAKVALYFLDWLRTGVSQTVSIRDATSGTELDFREIANFGDGKYLVYEVEGNVSIVISSSEGEATLSGVLVGEGVPPPINDRPLMFTILGSGPEGLRVRVAGAAGQRFSVQSSGDLQTWNEVMQSILLGDSTELTVRMEANGRGFFRTENRR